MLCPEKTLLVLFVDYYSVIIIKLYNYYPIIDTLLVEGAQFCVQLMACMCLLILRIKCGIKFCAI